MDLDPQVNFIYYSLCCLEKIKDQDPQQLIEYSKDFQKLIEDYRKYLVNIFEQDFEKLQAKVDQD